MPRVTLTMVKSLLPGSDFLLPDIESSYSSYKWKPAATISVSLKITTHLIFPNVTMPAFPPLGKVIRLP